VAAQDVPRGRAERPRLGEPCPRALEGIRARQGREIDHPRATLTGRGSALLEFQRALAPQEGLGLAKQLEVFELAELAASGNLARVVVWGAHELDQRSDLRGQVIEGPAGERGQLGGVA
jgi:hypothetical protein